MTLKMPLTEVRLESTGFVVRESLTQDFKIDYPLMPVHTHDQWRMIYDNLLDFDVEHGDLSGFFSYVKDPFMILHYLLQRSPDGELQHRCCLATKYPV